MHDRQVRAMVDPEGRRVVLSDHAWLHILGSHEEMEAHLDAVVLAVERPTVRRPGRAVNEEWYFAALAGPSRWLHVVVHFCGEEGSVTTAFGRGRLP